MKNPLFTATVKLTKEKIEVYRHYKGGWVDYSDCKTIYEPNELYDLKEIK